MTAKSSCALVAALSLWVACAPQAPQAQSLDIWDGTPSGGPVNAADTNDDDPGPPAANDDPPTVAPPLSAAQLLDDPSATLAELDDGGMFEESPTNNTPNTNASDVPPLSLDEAVDFAAVAVADYIAALDPFRNLLGTTVDFAAMPASGLSGDCPAVAYVATNDSAAWALAVDYEFHPDQGDDAEAIVCTSDVDNAIELAGVVGLLRARDSATVRLVAEKYERDGTPIDMSGTVAVSGTGGADVELDGSVDVSLDTRSIVGDASFNFAQAGSVQVLGNATIANSQHALEASLLNVRVNPAADASHVPSAGGVEFELANGSEVSILFRAESPTTGSVYVIVDNQPAQEHVVAAWAPAE